jgi:hypothetical protein
MDFYRSLSKRYHSHIKYTALERGVQHWLNFFYESGDWEELKWRKYDAKTATTPKTRCIFTSRLYRHTLY